LSTTEDSTYPVNNQISLWREDPCNYSYSVLRERERHTGAIRREAFDIPHISTGDIFRENIRGDTALGKEAKRYLDAGELVPDSVTNAMVRDRLRSGDCSNGFLLDGFPRTLDQAKELDDILSTIDKKIDAVVNLVAFDDAVIERLMKRGRGDDTRNSSTQTADLSRDDASA